MCLDAMSGARWFSAFDLRSSYHQVAMEEEYSHKTAFVCREGQFKFKTMPFGLCNTGATFQRLMDMVMSGLAFEVCLVYLDDAIVFSSTVDFQRLTAVLTRPSKAEAKQVSTTSEARRIPWTHSIGGRSEYRSRESTCDHGLANSGESAGSTFVRQSLVLLSSFRRGLCQNICAFSRYDEEGRDFPMNF